MYVWSLILVLCSLALAEKRVGVPEGTVDTVGQAADTVVDTTTGAEMASDSVAEADTVIGVQLADTADTADMDTADSRPAAPSVPSSAAQADTGDTVAFWLSPYVGFNVAWTLGSFPLFTTWQRGLPTALSEFGLASDLLLGDSTTGIDTARLRYETKEAANSYNIVWPLGVSYTFMVREQSSLTARLAFMFIRKQHKATLQADSVPGRVLLEQNLGLYSVSLGLDLRRAISPRYFSVDNTNRTDLSLGMAIHPVTFLNRNDEVDLSANAPAEMRPVYEAVSAVRKPFSSWGVGISWSAGISSIKRLSPHTGLRTSLCYIGRWFYFGEHDQDELRTIGSREGYQPLSSVSHRFAIMLSLLRGRKVEEPVTETPVADQQP